MSDVETKKEDKLGEVSEAEKQFGEQLRSSCLFAFDYGISVILHVLSNNKDLLEDRIKLHYKIIELMEEVARSEITLIPSSSEVSNSYKDKLNENVTDEKLAMTEHYARVLEKLIATDYLPSLMENMNFLFKPDDQMPKK